MEKFLTVFLLVLFGFLVGLFVWPPEDQRVESKTEQAKYVIIEIEGCEYIEVDRFLRENGRAYSLTHKGNCKNKIHGGG